MGCDVDSCSRTTFAGFKGVDGAIRWEGVSQPIEQGVKR